jgi:hypothetical protein
MDALSIAKIYTFATISRLVLLNIIKLTNNKEHELINYKVHGCILHASPPTLTT